MAWDTGEKHREAEDCDYAEEMLKGYTIDIDDDVYRVIRAMAKKFPEHEWQMLLTGTITDNKVHVTGYAIPKQEVMGASVKNLDVVNKEVVDALHIVATIHSHVDMGVFFSQTDRNDTNLSIIDHHIVVNNKGEYKACSKVHLPCGMVHLMESDVTIGGEELNVLEIKGLENIEVTKTTELVGAWDKGWNEYKGLQGGWDRKKEWVNNDHYYKPKHRPDKKRKKNKDDTIEITLEEYHELLEYQAQKEAEEYNRGFGVDYNGNPIDKGGLGVGL